MKQILSSRTSSRLSRSHRAVLGANLWLTNHRLLSDTTITDLNSLATAIQVLHKTYQVPHVIITSLRLTRDNQTLPSRAASGAPSKAASATASGHQSPSAFDSAASRPQLSQSAIDSAVADGEVENITIIGSTATSDHKPRLFRIDLPLLPLFFSGTGDMFAALTVPRLIEAVHASSTPNLASTASWRSPDDVPATELPLAKACQKVLASMQSILVKTTEVCKEKMAVYDTQAEKTGCGEGEEVDRAIEKKRHLALMNASEVKVVRHAKDMLDPPDLDRFRPKAVETVEEHA